MAEIPETEQPNLGHLGFTKTAEGRMSIKYPVLSVEDHTVNILLVLELLAGGLSLLMAVMKAQEDAATPTTPQG